MNILVGISRVPDTATKVMVGDDGRTIASQGVKYILNPYDEYAIEEGLQLKQKHGGSVTVVTVADEAGKDILRTALAMGVDKAVLVRSKEESDSFGVAADIVAVAKDIAPDLIIFGRQSIDFDSFQMAPMVAELLDWPSVSIVSTLSVDGTTLQLERDVEGGKETITTTLPCVISAQKGLNDPRYPKLPDIIKAKSKPIEERESTSEATRVSVIAMENPPAKNQGKVLGDSDTDIAELVRLLHEEAKVI